MKIRKKKRSSKKTRKPIFLHKPELTLEEIEVLAIEFLDYLRVKNYAQSTVKSKARDIGEFLEWAIERDLVKVNLITKQIIESYQRFLYRYRTKKGNPLSFRTQNLRLVHLRSFFSFLCKKDYLNYNPAFDLELPKIERTLPRDYLSIDEVEQILSIPNLHDPLGLRDRAILETLYSTGIRRMEVCNLSIYDLDRSLGYLRIREGKGKKDRVVPIGDRAIGFIEKYLLEVRPNYKPKPDDGYLFLMVSSDPFAPDILSNLVKSYIKKANLGKTGSCHMFRHTFATIMLEQGADIRYIQKMLGHASLESTEVYTHVAIKKLKEIHSMMHPARLERTKGENFD